MGAKTWMLVYASGDPRQLLAAGPVLDRDATSRLVTRCCPSNVSSSTLLDAELVPLARFTRLSPGWKFWAR